MVFYEDEIGKATACECKGKTPKTPRTLEKIKIRELRNGLQLIKILKIYHFLGVRLPEQSLIIGTPRGRILWTLFAMCSGFNATATNLTCFLYASSDTSIIAYLSVVSKTRLFIKIPQIIFTVKGLPV
ncbi:hypothetical protein F384_08870 [Citrobacter amalonaticus Y19]|uniref:Uncharacterized protein n=1 Tax=Citrobacter amalonaticus Y19 TaxID=1261127 RepID=A0A0F6TV52_CITAM|nr:hypothetical protein F384_08870 [Citrobacter amalonaticus Y19]